MADPVTGTIAAVGLASSALGGMVSAYGNWFGGESKGAMHDYQAGIALMNAQVAQRNAEAAQVAGEVEAQQSGMKARYAIGTTKAAQAASGLDVGSGSAAAVREGMYKVAQQDLSIIRSNAAKKAYGYEVEAASKTAESQLEKYAGSYERTAGKIAAIGSLLGGASSTSSKYLSGKSAGVWG